VNPALAAGITSGAHAGAKRILMYDAYVHPQSDLDSGKCGAGTTLRDRHTWVVNTLKMLEQLPEVKPPDIDQPNNTSDAEMGEILQDPPQHQATWARDSTNPWQA
jgi:hypothetical protein